MLKFQLVEICITSCNHLLSVPHPSSEVLAQNDALARFSVVEFVTGKIFVGK